MILFSFLDKCFSEKKNCTCLKLMTHAQWTVATAPNTTAKKWEWKEGHNRAGICRWRFEGLEGANGKWCSKRMWECRWHSQQMSVVLLSNYYLKWKPIKKNKVRITLKVKMTRKGNLKKRAPQDLSMLPREVELNIIKQDHMLHTFLQEELQSASQKCPLYSEYDFLVFESNLLFVKVQVMKLKIFHKKKPREIRKSESNM